MEDSPFTILYNGLWRLVERNENLADAIKKGNRIKYENWTGFKDNISSADLPELSLIVEGGSINFQSTSSHSTIMRTYTWVLTYGGFQVTGYNNLLFELVKGLVDWDSVICGLLWQSEQFVTKAALASFEEGTLNVQNNRGIRGWSAMLQLEVEMNIPTALLRITDP